MRRGCWVVPAACLALVVAVAPLQAQRRGGRRGAQDRAELEQRIRAEMGRLMRERLGLDEDQAERLSEVVRGFDRERRELFRLEQTARREVEDLRREDDADEAAAGALLNRMIELRRREADLFAEEQEALLEVLTPLQVLELQALREQIGRRIRALRGGRGDDPEPAFAPRRGRGGSPPGAGSAVAPER